MKSTKEIQKLIQLPAILQLIVNWYYKRRETSNEIDREDRIE